MAMILTYDEFCKVVPERTAKFVTEILPYFHYYIDRNLSISIDGDDADKTLKRVLIMLNYKYNQTDPSKTKLFLGTENYSPRPAMKKTENASEYDLNQVFTNSISSFCVFNNIENYAFLSPEQIILDCCKEYDRVNNTSIRCLFNYNYDAFRRFINSYSSYVDTIEREAKEDKKTEFYGDLSIDEIAYLEMIGKVHAYIKNYISNGNTYNKEVIIDDKDIQTISVLTALYFVPNTAAIMLKENGLDLTSFLKYLGLTNLSKSEVEKQTPNIYTLSKYYNKYIYEGKNKGKASSEITIASIASNLFDRKLNNSIIFEKILTNCSTSYEKFKNFDKLIEQYTKKAEANRTQEKMKEFYQNLPQKTIEYIELVSKIYTVIIDKMKAGAHNEEVLFNNVDADTLSLFLAMYHVSPKAVTLFNEFGLEYAKVLEFLKIDITKEEIDKTPVNIDALTNVFQRFIFDGINKGKKSQDITVNHVAKNICDREFNKTLIMERIISELNKNVSIQSNFLPQLETYLVSKEDQRKRNLEQKFYGELSASTIKYIKRAEKTFQYLMTSNRASEFSVDDMVELSLALAYYNNCDTRTYAEFIKSRVAIGSIYSKLNISGDNDNRINNSSSNIDNISANYGRHVFGGYNKDKSKALIKTDDVVKNIFNRELNKSVSLNQLLGELGSSRDSFDNFDERYQEYTDEIVRKQVDEAKQNVQSINCPNTIRYLTTVSQVAQVLEECMKAGTCHKDDLRKEDDVKESAVLLSLFLESNDISRFLEKRGITLAKCLEYLQIDMDIFAEYVHKAPDYLMIQNKYKNYIGYYWSNANIDEIAKSAFADQSSVSNVAENIVAYCEASYSTVKEEVTTKTEVIVPLSKEEELALFISEPISIIDTNNCTTILNSGNNLAKHAKKISDEVGELVLQDSRELSRMESVKGSLEAFKTTLPKKKGFFFGKPATPEELQRQMGNNLSELSTVYDYFYNQAGTLTEQIEGYSHILNYMKVYVWHIEEEIEQLKVERDSKVKEIEKNRETGTFFDGSDDDNVANMIMGRLQYMEKARVDWIKEYLKVKMMLTNHINSLNQVHYATTSLIPITAIEKCISQGLITQKETIGPISSMINVLAEVMTTNMAAINDNTIALQENLTPLQIEAVSAEIRKGIPAIVGTEGTEVGEGTTSKAKAKTLGTNPATKATGASE